MGGASVGNPELTLVCQSVRATTLGGAYMAQYEIWGGYSSNSLQYDSSAGGFVLDSGYHYSTGRFLATINDDDSQLDGGDNGANEVGNDANQTAVIRSGGDGTVIGSGQVYVEAYAEVQLPDGSTVTLQRIEIGGQHFGYIPDGPPLPAGGVLLPIVDTGNVDSSNAPEISELYSVPCFGPPGTHLMTTEGEVPPVDWIASGDRLITRDSGGAQPVLWVGRFRVPAADAQADDSLRPFLIEADALGGPGCRPTRCSCPPSTAYFWAGPRLRCTRARMKPCQRSHIWRMATCFANTGRRATLF